MKLVPVERTPLKTTLLVGLAVMAVASACRTGQVGSTTTTGLAAANCDKTAGEKPGPHPRKDIVFTKNGDDCTIAAPDVVVSNGGTVAWTVRNRCAASVTVSLDDKKHGPLKGCEDQSLTVAPGKEDSFSCTLDPKWAAKSNFCSAYGVDWEYGGSTRKLDPILDIRKGTTP